MATIHDIVLCPQCHNPQAHYTLDCRKLTEEVLCQICGYNSITKIDLEGFEKEIEENTGYGAIEYGKKGISCIVTFQGPFKDIDKAIKNFEEFLENTNQSGYLTFWDTETKKVKVLVGNQDILECVPEQFRD